MDEFEHRLKSIALAKPSEGVKRRVFGDRPSGSWFVWAFRQRIPLGWAAVFALITGLAGMFMSQLWSGPAAVPSKVLNVQIIKAPSERNLFDFTEPAAEFLPGDLTVKIETPEEI